MNDNLMLSEGEKILLDYPAQSSQIYGIMLASVPITIFFISFLTFFCTFFFGGLYQVLVVHSNQLPHFNILKIAAFVLTLAIVLLTLTYLRSVAAISRSRYVFTDQRCILINGTGFRGVDKKAIPYGRIADVNLYQGFIQSFFGTADVLIQEQVMGMPMMPMRMTLNSMNIASGLLMEQAEKVVQLVSEHVNKKS